MFHLVADDLALNPKSPWSIRKTEVSTYSRLPENKTDILDQVNCNTAVTYACAVNGECLIYRKEEWFKVFIHETFHAYEFQPDSVNDELLLEGIKSEKDCNDSMRVWSIKKNL